jgi:hypothetical protein
MKANPDDTERPDDLDAWFGKIERPRPPQNRPKCGAENV